MNTKLLLEESEKKRMMASSLLDDTKIAKYLEKYGEVNLIGSYAYQVMVAKDIDFHIVIKEFDEKIVKDFFDYTVASGRFDEIIFHDKHKFNKEAAARYASGNALDSYYFGLRAIYEAEEWQIGVNFIVKPQEAAVEIGKLFEKVTDEQRALILFFKKRIIELRVKVSSAYIYRAVLEKGIKGENELIRYLETIGYVF
jgi:hypothetical protein